MKSEPESTQWTSFSVCVCTPVPAVHSLLHRSTDRYVLA